MSISLENTSKFSEKIGDTSWYSWTAYISCSEPDSLDDIKFVEYHLHPTFKNPIRRIFKKDGGFPFKTRGWGVFNLRAHVVFKDERRKPELLEHFLQFNIGQQMGK